MEESLLSINDVEAPPQEAPSPLKVVKNQLGTFMGAFLPCSLSIFGIILYLRLGWVVGQGGVYHALLFILIGYLVAISTVLSLSAISTNGKVRGGGAYYMISRSLGPEFGGGIGVVFFFANIFAAAMYLLGGAEVLTKTFHIYIIEGSEYWSQVILASIVLFALTVVAVIGANLFAKSGFLLFSLMVISIVTGILSLMFRKPGASHGYRGWSHSQLSSNMSPHYKDGYNFQSTFSIFFPAVTGIMAGANMSGDLKEPGKAIPRGTLGALLTSLVVYIFLVWVYAVVFERSELQDNYLVLQDISYPVWLFIPGEFSSLFASAMAQIIGASRVLQALARDDLVPGLSFFKKGSQKGDEPRRGVIISYLLVQCFVFLGNLNAVAPFNTMSFLFTYGVTNIACFIHSITGAPNFRPTFKYFTWKTALFGTFACFGTMFFVSPLFASVAIVFVVTMMVIVHIRAPMKEWGDFTQALIFHQVRKYLLRLDRKKDHVKYWRPSLMLAISDPRRAHNVMHFANNLKKGGLYVIANVFVGDFRGMAREVKQQTDAYRDYIASEGMKAFPEVIVARTLRQGIENLILTAGLGGMKPNIILFGLPDSSVKGPAKSTFSSNLKRGKSKLPSAPSVDSFVTVEGEACQTADEYCNLLHDCLLFDKSIMIHRNMERLDVETMKHNLAAKKGKMTVDMWPFLFAHEGYSLTMQMGLILSRTKVWKKYSRLRLMNFVVHKDDVEAEKERCEGILRAARISAEVVIVSIDQSRGDFDFEEKEMVSDMSMKLSGSYFSNLNRVVASESEQSAAVFMTVPPPPRQDEDFSDYMRFLSSLSDDLPPTLMVIQSGEVMTTDL